MERARRWYLVVYFWVILISVRCSSLPTSQLLRRPHKGPRTTSRSAKRETLSMRRVRNVMSMTGSNEMPSELRVNVLSPLDWVSLFFRMNGDILTFAVWTVEEHDSESGGEDQRLSEPNSFCW